MAASAFAEAGERGNLCRRPARLLAWLNPRPKALRVRLGPLNHETSQCLCAARGAY